MTTERSGMSLDEATRIVAQACCNIEPTWDAWLVLYDHLSRDAVAVKWGHPENVGELIAQLRTIDPTEPIHAAYFVDIDGVKRAKTKGVMLSRERVSGNNICTGDASAPYANVLWSAQDERHAAVPDWWLHRITWIKDVTCDKGMDTTRTETDRIHRFATELHKAMLAQRDGG